MLQKMLVRTRLILIACSTFSWFATFGFHNSVTTAVVVMAAATTTSTSSSSCDATSCPNCLDLAFDRRSSDNPPITFHFSMYGSSTLSKVMERNESFVSFCLPEFECAELLGFFSTHNQSTEYGAFNASMNGDNIWAAQTPFDVSTYNMGEDFNHLLYIGDNCNKYKYSICGDYSYSSSLLDVKLRTTADTVPEESVYWRVYTGLGSNSYGNLLHDPFLRRYRPSRTYRTLHCIEDSSSFGSSCPDFGLRKTNAVEYLEIKYNGELHRNNTSWDCFEGLCDGDTVTPLCDDNDDDLLSTWGIVGVVMGTTFLLLLLVGLLLYKKRNIKNEH